MVDYKSKLDHDSELHKFPYLHMDSEIDKDQSHIDLRDIRLDKYRLDHYLSPVHRILHHPRRRH